MDALYFSTTLLQALAASSNLSEGGELSSISGQFKGVGMTIAGLGLLFAGLAVVKKLANNADNAKGSLISWLVALAVYLAIWSVL